MSRICVFNEMQIIGTDDCCDVLPQCHPSLFGVAFGDSPENIKPSKCTMPFSSEEKEHKLPLPLVISDTSVHSQTVDTPVLAPACHGLNSWNLQSSCLWLVRTGPEKKHGKNMKNKPFLLATQIRDGEKKRRWKIIVRNFFFLFTFGFLKCGDSVIQQIK
jgi:hypothetical protein